MKFSENGASGGGGVVLQREHTTLFKSNLYWGIFLYFYLLYPILNYLLRLFLHLI